MRLRVRMVVSMLLVGALCAGVSALVGGFLLWRQLRHEAGNRVRQDLNAARAFYDHRLSAMETVLQHTALGERFSQAVASRDVAYVAPRLKAVLTNAGFDLLTVTDEAGEVICRAHPPGSSGDSLAGDRLIGRVLAGQGQASGTELVPLDALARESPTLAQRVRIAVLETPKARSTPHAELDSAMMLCAAAPVVRPDGKPAGALCAGILLNRNYDLVDRVQNTVFRDERYRGKMLGTATIFQGDVRISTNVRREDGSRAIGTRASAEVHDHVLTQGQTWLGPAWVVNDWYLSAYEPIRDPGGQVIGMLYVGVLESKSNDLAAATGTIFGLLTAAGLLVAGVLAWKLSGRIARPVSHLASASGAIARGDFSLTLPVESTDEIGALTGAFNTMAGSLRERDELLKARAREQLTRSERLASVGRLAAGVAHEINNPLTGVLTFAHMLHRKAPAGTQDREDLETIIKATTRCKDIVRGLLNFSRQVDPNVKPSDLNAVVREALDLTRNQAGLTRVRVVEDLAADLPPLVIDAGQIQQVAVNLLLNAIDAMPDGGTVTVRTGLLAEDAGRWAELEVSDTGCGIAPGDLDRVFDPFFTTKPPGKGTGLGLAIAHGIVSAHRGRIVVSSQPGRGTTFTVRLPAPPRGATP